MSNVCVECEHHSLKDVTEKYGFFGRKTRMVQKHMCSGMRDSITGEVIKLTCQRARYGNRYFEGWCRWGGGFEPKES